MVHDGLDSQSPDMLTGVFARILVLSYVQIRVRLIISFFIRINLFDYHEFESLTFILYISRQS